ncbi:MAG: RHS repeat domain-containing protein, partial [Candidatus Saccharimonadales bacterium]
FSGPSAAGDDTVYTEEQIGTQGQAGTETWPLGDNENTPHEDVNNGSAVVDHIIANTFGVVTSESNSSIHHWSGFEGGHLDVDTAMVDDYFRWYDPATAKWLSEDPLDFVAGDNNLSRYSGNSPTAHSDATGLLSGSIQQGGWLISYWVQYFANGGYVAHAILDGPTVEGEAGHTDGWDIMPLAPGGTAGMPTGYSGGYLYYSSSAQLALANVNSAQQTSVLSLMVENDPTLMERMKEAQDDMAKLAEASVMFTVTGPFLAQGADAKLTKEALDWLLEQMIEGEEEIGIEGNAEKIKKLEELVEKIHEAVVEAQETE